MSDVTEIAKVAIGPIAAAIAGGWAYLAARAKAKPGVATSQADLTKALNDQTKLLLAESAKDRRALKRRVDHQGRELTRLGGQVADCHTRHADCEDSLTRLQERIDKMMADLPPALNTELNPNDPRYTHAAD